MGEGQQGAHWTRREAIRRKVQQHHARFYAHCKHWAFADKKAPAPLHWHGERWALGATVTCMVLLSAVAIPSWANAMKRTAPLPQTTVRIALPSLPPAASHETPPEWHTVTVKPGQTLSVIFQDQGFGTSELQAALAATKKYHAMQSIRPGDQFAFQADADGQLKALRFDPNDTQQVTLHFDGNAVRRTIHKRVFALRQRAVHGIITHSLSGAMAAAHLSPAVSTQLAHIFRNKVNFSRDIRPGDEFTVIYNGVYRDGEYQHAGDILAAEFVNRGHRYTAYRFTPPDGHVGYYTASGRPLSVSLLRTPVKYTRVSSAFGWRVDPVLHARHLHAGVDLAAPMGTPIKAASGGVITTHRWVHGYGRYICIKLNSTYSTCYAHMSKYAKGLADGSHVHQGEVIGYVGMTGYATGPHLHFEVRVHGKPTNPLTVTMPKPKALAPKLLASFKAHTQPLLARLNMATERYAMVQKARKADGHSERAG